MAPIASIADALVEQGLELYSAGRLDEALARWTAALDREPGHPRALQYLNYVQENRVALERAFVAPGAESASEGGGGDDGIRDLAPELEPDPELEPGALGFDADSRSDEPLDLDVVFEAEDPSEAHGARGAEVLPSDRGTATPATLRSVEEDADFLSMEPTPVRLSVSGLPRIHVPPSEGAALDPEPAFAETATDALIPDIATPSTFAPAGSPPPWLLSRSSDENIPVAIDWGDGAVDMQSQQKHYDPPAIEPFSAEPLAELMPALSADVFDLGQQSNSEDFPEVVEISESLEVATAEGVDVGGDAPSTAGDLDQAQNYFDTGDYEQSLAICQRLLASTPNLRAALDLKSWNEGALLHQYKQRIPDLEAVPVVQVAAQDIMWQKLDHRAGFMLSRIDGMLTYGEILDICGMSMLEAFRILVSLLDRGVIGSTR